MGVSVHGSGVEPSVQASLDIIISKSQHHIVIFDIRLKRVKYDALLHKLPPYCGRGPLGLQDGVALSPG
jgi:hypothetical protein